MTIILFGRGFRTWLLENDFCRGEYVIAGITLIRKGSYSESWKLIANGDDRPNWQLVFRIHTSKTIEFRLKAPIQMVRY